MKHAILALLFSCWAVSSNAQIATCNPAANENKRQQVKTSNAPNSFTCYMEMKRRFSKSLRLATGFLIAPRVLLTAGHNLAYYPSGDVEYVNLYFGSVAEGQNLCHTTINLKANVNKFFKPGYWLNQTILNDYSIIILPDNSVFEKVGGYYKIAPVTEANPLTGDIHITGSPMDKDEYQMWTASTQGYFILDNSIRYDLFTEERNSGSPIWQQTANGYQCTSSD